MPEFSSLFLCLGYLFLRNIQLTQNDLLLKNMRCSCSTKVRNTTNKSNSPGAVTLVTQPRHAVLCTKHIT